MVDVHPAQDRRELAQFVDYPYTRNRGDAHWVNVVGAPRPKPRSVPRTRRCPCFMESSHSGRFSCGRSMAITSCLRFSRRNGRKSR